MHRPCDVLGTLLSHIVELVAEVAHIFVYTVTDTNPSRFGQGFEPRRDIDAIAIDVPGFGYDVALVDADAKPDAPIFGNPPLALEHTALDFDGAAHRIGSARKLSQEPIAHLLDDTPGMLGDLRLDKLVEMSLDALVGSCLVSPHQPRVALHIGAKDRDKTVNSGHFSPGATGFSYRAYTQS